MKNFAIAVKDRVGTAEETRAEGFVPAVMYGPKQDPKSVAVDYKTFEKLYQEAGNASLVDITTPDNQTTKVLIQEVQFDPIKDTIIHADFRQIDMDKEINAVIDVKFVGEAPAVKTLGGTLNKGLERLSITCLPKDLIHHVEVDLSNLKTFEDIIRVENLQLPQGVKVQDNADTVIAKVAAPLTEEQLKAMEESQAASVEDIEVEEKGKKEEEGEKAAEGEKKE